MNSPGKKWQREWEGCTENKLNEIKPCIAMPTFTTRKFDVIFTRLRIGHSRLTQTLAL